MLARSLPDLARQVLVVLGTCLMGCMRPAQAPAPATELPPGTILPHDPHAASRFSAGDGFEVRVMGESDLSGFYRVAPDGTIDFPLCGRLNVDGLIASDVANKLKNCLVDGKYFRDPQVVVIGREVGVGRKITVLGSVQKAGSFPYQDNMSIMEAIALASGFASFAGQNQISVTRRAEDGHEQKFRVPVQDIGLGKAPNFLLRPGDTVYVPESAF